MWADGVQTFKSTLIKLRVGALETRPLSLMTGGKLLNIALKLKIGQTNSLSESEGSRNLVQREPSEQIQSIQM